ncbi:MAG TPA: hypothetical protein VHM19_18000, partial [Polyangiales bacterium]|nr:hypothetical protein [Polyangiales bacterium]
MLGALACEEQKPVAPPVQVGKVEQHATLAATVSDTTISSAVTAGNAGGSQYLFVGELGSTGSNATLRTLIKPTLSSLTANGTDVTNVQIKLHVNKGDTGYTLYAYKANQTGWVQGSGVFGTNASCGGSDCYPPTMSGCSGATWGTYNCVTGWGVTGAATGSARASATYGAVTAGWYELSGANLAADAEGWINAGSTAGWVIESGGEGVAGSATRMESSTNGTVANRASVTITYSCYSGYSGSSCADVDECASGAVNACGTGATNCVNSAGSYTCTCNSTYFTGTGTTSCVDINECNTNNGGCGSATYWTCTNNVGAAPTCTDINECNTNNGGCGSATYWTCTN